MLRLILGLATGVIILPVFGWLYFRFGYAPVATASSPMPFEHQLAHMALKARIRKEAPKNSPLQASDSNILAGVRTYRAHGAICHGLPDQPPSPTSKGMFPDPPQLFKGHGVTDDPVGETYWKVSNGVRLTGMPAYTGSLTQAEMWQVSLPVANADKLPQQIRGILEPPLGVN
jgi:mono/diheme cytochrome c family protein